MIKNLPPNESNDLESDNFIFLKHGRISWKIDYLGIYKKKENNNVTRQGAPA